MRRLRRSKRGAGDEAFEEPPFLAIAAFLVLFTLALGVRWFWMLFIAGPSVWDSYAIANFGRLNGEIGTMLETGRWDDARIIPYTLTGSRITLVGINPGMAIPKNNPHDDGCIYLEEGEIKVNRVCQRFPCLCLCEGTDCSDKNNCKVFKKSEYDTEVRFVGLGQEGFNAGRHITDLTDWNGEPLHELMLYPLCSVDGWGEEFQDTGNLYVEETRGEDGYTTIIIGREDDATRAREEAIRERARQQEEEDRQRQEEERQREAEERRRDVMSRGEGQVVCGIENPATGIDVSYHQGVIDWAKVAADGVDFAFIRASAANSTHIYGDTQFQNNWQGAKENGIKRGAYHFFRADKDAERQAEVFLEQLGGDYGEFPPVIDVEMQDGNPYEVSREQWIDGISTWIDIVESRTGMKPIIYTGPGYWNGAVNTDYFSEYPLWVANWDVDCPRTPTTWDNWVFWQTCEGCQPVDGIKNPVDADVFNGDMDQLVAYVQQVAVT